MDQLSITNQFEEQDSLVSWFTRVLNMTVKEQDVFYDDGFGSLKDICLEYRHDVQGFKDYLKGINKTMASRRTDNNIVRLSPILMNQLVGVVHYFNMCVYTLHTIPSLENVTREKATHYGRVYSRLKEMLDQESEDLSITIPEFKGQLNWRNVKDLLLTKLELTASKAGIPMSYLVDEAIRRYPRVTSLRGEIIEIDIEDMDYLKTNAVHFGVAYKEDNLKLWNILKIAFMNSPGYYIIQPFEATKNGRKAYLALKNFYEGEDFIARSIEEAFVKLNSTYYKGETSRFNFEKYINIHLESHKLLIDAGYQMGRGMDEATKCQYLKNGIRPEAGLENALSLTRSNGLAYGNFQNFVSFLSAEVQHKNARKQQVSGGQVRNVSATSQSGKKRNNQMRTRETANGKTSQNSTLPSRVVEGKKIEGRRYPQHEYVKFTKAQKKACAELKRERWGKRDQGHRTSTTSPNIGQGDFGAIGRAVISGLMSLPVPSEERTNSNTTQGSNTMETSPASAASGSVGEFLRKRRRIERNE